METWPNVGQVVQQDSGCTTAFIALCSLQSSEFDFLVVQERPIDNWTLLIDSRHQLLPC